LKKKKKKKRNLIFDFLFFFFLVNMKNKSTFKILTCYTEKYHILLELNESNNIDFMGVILIPILNDVELFKLVRDY